MIKNSKPFRLVVLQVVASPNQNLDIQIDYESLLKVGAMMGSAADWW